MARKPKPPKQTHIRVRLDNDLLARLEKERAANGRTLTGEIVYRLEDSFQQQDLHKLIAIAATTSAQVILEAAQKYSDEERALQIMEAGAKQGLGVTGPMHRSVVLAVVEAMRAAGFGQNEPPEDDKNK
jgi:TraY domain